MANFVVRSVQSSFSACLVLFSWLMWTYIFELTIENLLTLSDRPVVVGVQSTATQRGMSSIIICTDFGG